MAIQNVTIFTCDMCKTTEQRNLKKDDDGELSEAGLPPYWLEVNTRAYLQVGKDEIIRLLCIRCATLTRNFFSQLPATRRLEDSTAIVDPLFPSPDIDPDDMPPPVPKPFPNKPIPPYVPRKG